MYGNSYYPQTRYQTTGVPTSPMATQTYMPPVQPTQPMQPIQPITPVANPIGIQGKVVDSIEVVKATDIPLDGSTSYFPLTDGSAIVTKQLQADGTSKTVVYKPTDEEKYEAPKYVTFDELQKALDGIDFSESIDKLKDKFDDLREEFKEFKKSKKKDD